MVSTSRKNQGTFLRTRPEGLYTGYAQGGVFKLDEESKKRLEQENILRCKEQHK